MNGSKQTPAQWLPMYFDRYKTSDSDRPPISEEEIEDLQQLMQQMNEKSEE
jgi:hypothetical protein